MKTYNSLIILGIIICVLASGISSTAQQLPPGIPKVVDTNGNIIYIDSSFTTAAYQNEAFNLVLEEANKVAYELRLPENLPITKTNVVAAFISPFGFAYSRKAIGNITTKKYTYYVSVGDKFSFLDMADADQTCMEYRDCCMLLTSQIDTNEAYRLATQWLAAASMDVEGLNRDCQVKVEIDPYWNRIKPGTEFAKTNFVPIYDVYWLSSENRAEGGGDTASVELFAPTKTLIHLDVQDPKYILRKPLVFTNLASLFPGTARTITNYPIKPIVLPTPVHNY